MATNAVGHHGICCGSGSRHARIGRSTASGLREPLEHRQSIMNPQISSKSSVVPRRICIVGLLHPATVLWDCFTKMGHWVTTVGDDEAAVAELGRGKSPVVEPKLDAMLRRTIKSGHLKFTSHYDQALQQAEFVFIAIDTPVDRK